MDKNKDEFNLHILISEYLNGKRNNTRTTNNEEYNKSKNIEKVKKIETFRDFVISLLSSKEYTDINKIYNTSIYVYQKDTVKEKDITLCCLPISFPDKITWTLQYDLSISLIEENRDLIEKDYSNYYDPNYVDIKIKEYKILCNYRATIGVKLDLTLELLHKLYQDIQKYGCIIIDRLPLVDNREDVKKIYRKF